MTETASRVRPASEHIPRYDCNRLGRDFAVGDIHGQFSALKAALRLVDFQPATDRLFSVGDMIDRGPESHRVLEWLDKPWFFALMGNHEYMALRWASGNAMPLGYLEHGGEWLQEQPPSFQEELVERFSRLPLACEVETEQGLIGMVHADCPYDDWGGMYDSALHVSDLTDSRHTVADRCLWSADRYRYRYEGVVKGVRALVHGHVTLPRPKQLGNVFFIDTAQPDGTGFTLLQLDNLLAHGCTEPENRRTHAAADH